MHRFYSLVLSAGLLFTTTTALAGIEVVFTESAPKDRIEITNTSSCVYAELLVEIDLENTAGKLIFDTTSSGAGVEVFQPFEVQKGDIKLVSSTSVNDGDTALTVQVNRLKPGETAIFTIDVDDRLPAGELGMIRVSDSEMSGGSVHLQLNGGKKFSAVFNDSNRLSMLNPPC